jgi:hypothetical protein
VSVEVHEHGAREVAGVVRSAARPAVQVPADVRQDGVAGNLVERDDRRNGPSVGHVTPNIISHCSLELGL